MLETESPQLQPAAPAPASTPSWARRVWSWFAAPNASRPPLRSPLPVLGGRLGIAIGLLAGMALVSAQWLNGWIDRALHPAAPKPVQAWQVGTEADVELTLISADARRLHCAHDSMVEGAHCGYTATKRNWPRSMFAPLDANDHDVIQPYRTADTNALILVAGLWAEPELAMRLHREPPTQGNVDKQLRFVAYCKVKFIGELKAAGLRWESGGKWHENESALVAKPVRCTLEPPQG